MKFVIKWIEQFDRSAMDSLKGGNTK